MKIVQSNQALLGNDPYQMKRHPLVVVPLNDFKEVDSHDLKDHHIVVSIGA